jgi:hypothetical protein
MGAMGAMGDENVGVPGADDGMGSNTRVGTAERDGAIAQLGEH